METHNPQSPAETSHVSHAHPGEAVYIKVALFLAAVTAFEIAVSYLKWAEWVTIVMLIVLSVIKFVAVVGYFMHLKFDNRALRKPFITGLVLAIAIYTIVLLAFTLHSNAPPAG